MNRFDDHAEDLATRANDAAANDPSFRAAQQEFSGIFTSTRQALLYFFELLSLEAQRAGHTLMWMVAWGTIASMLVVTAWLGFMGAIALWAVALGANWGAAVTVLALVNLALAATIITVCVKMSRDLLFPATRRQFTASTSSTHS